MGSFPIALLIPCYNAAAYLPELFGSVNAQTAPFAEVICFDDGSSDETASVASSLGARVIRGKNNQGAAFGRNRLLEATKCEWVHFHDADDLLDPAFVEVMSREAAILNTPVLCGMRVLDRTTKRLVGQVSYQELNDTRDYVAYFLEHIGFSIIGVYPRSALLQIGGFREDVRGNEDPDLHVRLAMAGCAFNSVERELVTNLMHRDSFSARNWQECMQDRLRCLLDYAQILDQKYHCILGKQTLAVAWSLYSGGSRRDARLAIESAKKLGIKELDSHRWATRFLSRTIGFEPVWWMKRAITSRSLDPR